MENHLQYTQHKLTSRATNPTGFRSLSPIAKLILKESGWRPFWLMCQASQPGLLGNAVLTRKEDLFRACRMGTMPPLFNLE